MAEYATQLEDLQLFRELDLSRGRDGIGRSDVDSLRGLVTEVADAAGELLARVPSVFRQYTKHDFSHCVRIIDLMGRFIPEETRTSLNVVEISALMLSAILHDFGMFVTDEERRQFLDEDGFRYFLYALPEKAEALEQARKSGSEYRARLVQDAALADYFRRRHPERARQNIIKHFEALRTMRFDLLDSVARICESHGWGVHESIDVAHPEKAVARLDPERPFEGIPFNEQYIACCLRLADVIDFDCSRTPMSLFRSIDFDDPRSRAEWEKHLAVRGWRVDERDVRFHAECTDASQYVAVMDFVSIVDRELDECVRLVMYESPPAVAARYKLHLHRAADRSRIRMADPRYIAGAFRFELDYERIMKLLMDRSLYPDPSLCLRELLQNALDACRHRKAVSTAIGDRSYKPRITIRDRSSDASQPEISVEDNGMGMSLVIIENYFMRVGRSYYRSGEFIAEQKKLLENKIELEATSQFGIGILSCFMLTDSFEVVTKRLDGKPLKINVEGPTRYMLIERLAEPSPSIWCGEQKDRDRPPASPGTCVTLKLRPGVKVDVENAIRTFAVNVDAPITIEKGGTRRKARVHAWRWDHESVSVDDWLKWTEDQRRMNLTPINDALSGVIVLERVPLQQYDFSEHIRGGAFLCMVRDPVSGVTAPSAGSIQVEDVLCADPGPFFHRLWRHGETDLTIYRAIAEYLEKPSKQVPRSVGTLEYERRLYQVMSPRERDLVQRWLLARASGREHPWYQERRTVESLWRGTDDWADLGAIPYNIGGTKFRFALSGIHLPAGITDWNPMLGLGLPWASLFAAGVYLLDARGSRAPVPAANRLFVDQEEGEKFLAPLRRAAIRFTLDRATEDRGNPSRWRRWFSNIVMHHRAEQGIVEEFDQLLPYATFDFQRNGETEKLSYSDLRGRFDRFVPLSDGWGEGLSISMRETAVVNRGGRPFLDLGLFDPRR